MKKKFISSNMKILIFILILLVIISYFSGSIILIKSGYKISDYTDEFNITMNNLKNNLDFDFNTYNISKDYLMDDKIDEIIFNLSSQDIHISKYDGTNLKIEINNDNNISNDLLDKVYDNRLIFNVKDDTLNNSDILIKIPYTFNNKEKSLKIVTNSGNIDISDLSLNTLNVFSINGNISLSNLDCIFLNSTNSSGDINFNDIVASTESKFSSTSGKILGNGSFASLNCISSSGDINLKLISSLKDNINFTSSSGDITLSLPNDLNYKVNYQTTLGSLSASSKPLSFGSENYIINVNTISGELYIK